MDEKTRELVPLEESVPSEGEASATPALPVADELVMQVINVMDKIAERLDLESPHPSTAKRVRGARTVSREFVVALIAAVESMPEFEGLGWFNPAEARDVLEARDTYHQIAERTARFLASVKYTNEARWAKIVSDALITFKIASILAKDPKQAKLAAVVESLRQHLGHRGKKKKKDAPKPE